MLNNEERQWLLKLARNTIHSRLYSETEIVERPVSNALGEPCGAFVTIHKQGALRGCIGLVQAVKPLYKTVRDMAIASAFEDPRFPPLSLDEFAGVDIEISVMSPLRPIRDIEEIEVGKHGILIKSGFNQGLLLPQVASGHGWDRATFLEQTCYKAGLSGDCWRKKDTEIQIFSADVFGERDF
jgi:AmmeMemoRadiSam system protein A